MSTMGMQVELSMTAKGVQATLKDAQGAIVQTAQIVKSQLGASADQAGQGIAKLKEGLGRSRETMMFFTQALGELGPGGRTAQMALSGLGSMFLGGGVVGLGLAAAQVGVRIVTDLLGKEAAAAEEAKKKNDQVFEKLKSDAQAAAKAVQDFNAKARGVSSEDASLAASSAALNPAIAKARADMAARQASLVALQAAQDSGNAYAGQQDDIDTAAAAVRDAERVLDELLAQQKSFEDRRKQIAMTAAIEIENARRAADDQAENERKEKDKARSEQEKTEYERKYQAYYEHLNRLARAKEKADEDADRAKAKADAAGQAALDKRARNHEANVKRLAADEKRYLETIQPITDSVQAAFAGVVEGTMSVGDALRNMLASVLQVVMQTAIQQITANAAVAGSGAASSQAAVPIVGPALAAAAMAAVMGMVLGLTSMISASGGADIGNYAPLAQLHPQEMVLPAHIANPLRQSLASGGLGGGVTINISATDARGVRRLLLDNQPALAEAVGKALRDGRRFG